MENQHRKITGYRELSQEEVDLMNRVKQHGEDTAALLQDIKDYRIAIQAELCPITDDQFQESMRCIAEAKTCLQTGQMWFVRAVALPNSF